jgi:hypothetical protein
MLFESIRGYNAGGDPLPGWAQRLYQVDIVVWLVGRRIADLNAQLMNWADGICAIMQDKFDLGGLPCEVLAKSDEPTESVQEGSAVFAACAVHVTIDLWTQQGVTTIS